MQKKQVHALFCPVCLEKFNYSSRLPLLFRSGSTYCQYCVKTKRHLQPQIGKNPSQYFRNLVIAEIGWKNLDILQYVEEEIEEVIDENVKQQYMNLYTQKTILTEELEDTKVILVWQLYKINDKIRKIKNEIKKQDKNKRKQQEEIKKTINEPKEKMSLLIKDEKRKGHAYDEEIKQLEKTLKIFEKKHKSQKPPSIIQSTYKEVKRQGLQYNFEKINFPFKFENSDQQQQEFDDQPVVKRITKFFM